MTSAQGASNRGKTPHQPRKLTIKVNLPLSGKTIEQAITAQLGLTHHAISRAKFTYDGILLDGQRSHSDARVHTGQKIEVVVGDSEKKVEESRVVPKDGPLAIVYEDDDILICDKPAGIAVHPGPGHFDDTLANRLAAHFEKNGEHATIHAVNRLDQGTSGLLVIAKNAHAQDRLQRKLHTDEFKRGYLAICHGCPDPETGVIDAPLGPDPTYAHRQAVVEGGKPARTRYGVIERFRDASLLSLELETGRTHQIRVHLAHIGCPLFGDAVYGPNIAGMNDDGKPSGTPDEGIDRPALHSAHLELTHPVEGTRLVFDSALPADMETLAERLRSL